jgi:hypothetical protein
MSSGCTRSIDSRPIRPSGSVSMTQSAEALIQRVVRSGSISEMTAEGARSSALSSLTATSAGMEPAAGSSDNAVMIRGLYPSRPPWRSTGRNRSFIDSVRRRPRAAPA